MIYVENQFDDLVVGGGKIKTIFRLINLLVGLIGDYTLKIKLH